MGDHRVVIVSRAGTPCTYQAPKVRSSPHPPEGPQGVSKGSTQLDNPALASRVLGSQ